MCSFARVPYGIVFHFVYDRGCLLAGMLRTLLQKPCLTGKAGDALPLLS